MELSSDDLTFDQLAQQLLLEVSEDPEDWREPSSFAPYESSRSQSYSHNNAYTLTYSRRPTAVYSEGSGLYEEQQSVPFYSQSQYFF